MGTRNHKLLKPYFQLYEKTPEGWFVCRLDYQVEKDWWDKVCVYGLTNSRIVIELFKLEEGIGYYAANLKLKKYYYCGESLELVWQKLAELKGLCHNDNVWYSSSLNEINREIIERRSVSVEASNKPLMLEYDGKQFHEVDASHYIAESDEYDFGVTWAELKQAFLELNGGKKGFYAFRGGEIFFSENLTEVRALLTAVAAN